MSYLYIIIAGVLWGMIPLFVKNLIGCGFSSIEIVAIRVWFGTALLTPYLLFRGKKYLSIELKDVKYFIGTGIISFVLFNYCYFNALQLCDISVAALLLYTSPIFVMLISIPVLKEKMTKIKGLSLVITMLGLSFITEVWGSSGNWLNVGLFYGLASGLTYALYSIFGKFVVNKYHILTITYYTFLVAAIGTIPLLPWSHTISCLSSSVAFVNSIGVAFFCTILSFLAYTKGLSGIDAGKAAVLATIEPLVATLVGYFWYNEILSISKIIGMILIFASILLLNMKGNK